MEPDPIAKQVLTQMHDRGMLLMDLAEQAGVHRSSLGRWLAGQRGMPVAKAYRVMQAVGLVVIPKEELHELQSHAALPRRPALAKTPRSTG